MYLWHLISSTVVLIIRVIHGESRKGSLLAPKRRFELSLISLLIHKGRTSNKPNSV